MQTKLVNVRGREFRIYNHGDYWSESKPEELAAQSVSPSRPASRLVTSQSVSPSSMFGTRPAPSAPRRTPARTLARIAANTELAEIADVEPLHPALNPMRRFQFGSYDRPRLSLRSDPRSVLDGCCVAFDVLSKPMKNNWREVVRRGAFDDACRYLTRLLVHHDEQFQLDDSCRLSCDDHGLYFHSSNAHVHNPILYRSCVSLIADGTLSGMSVCLPGSECDVIEYTDAKVREYRRIPRLAEVSLARTPQWPGTLCRSVARHHHLRPLDNYHGVVHSLVWS